MSYLRKPHTSMTSDEWATFQRAWNVLQQNGTVDRFNSIHRNYAEHSMGRNGCMPPKYLCGDLEKIATATIASASIPFLTSKQDLDGCEYFDGGTMYASPTTVMCAEVYRLIMGMNPQRQRLQRTIQISQASRSQKAEEVKTVQAIQYAVDKDNIAEVKYNPLVNRISSMGQRSLRLIYFCSYEMDVPKGQDPTPGTGGALPKLATVSQFLHANVLQDRSAAINLLYRICGDESCNIVYNHHAKLDKQGLAQVFKTLEAQRHYVLFLYPLGSPSVSMIKFTPQDIERAMDLTRSAYGAYSWHFPYPTQRAAYSG